MSRRKYPCIGSSTHRPKWIEQPKGAPKCCVCDARATHRVCVEFDIFRGDDELVNACGNHHMDADALAAAWVSKNSQAAAPSRAAEGREINKETP